MEVPRGVRGPSPTSGSQPRPPVLGRGDPLTLAVKTSRDSARVRWRAAGDRGAPLRGLHTDALAHRLTRPGLQCPGGSLKSARDIPGTELTGFRVSDRGEGVRASLSEDGSAGRRHCAFVEPSSHPTSRRQI